MFQRKSDHDDQQPHTSHHQTEGGNQSSDGGSLPSPSTSPKEQTTHKKHRSGAKKSKKGPDTGNEQELLKTMSNTIFNIGDYVKDKSLKDNSPKSSRQQNKDDHDIWANLLASKVR